MSFQKENYEIYNICLTFLGITFVAIFVDWAITYDLLHVSNEKVADIFVSFYNRTHSKSIIIRLIFVFTSLAIFYLKPPIKIDADKDKMGRLIFSIIVIVFFLFGFSPFYFYNFYIFPMLTLLVVFSSYLIFTLLGKSYIDENIFGMSNKKQQNKLSYVFQTDKGPLTVHSAEQHMYVQGGSGAGKSDSILKPTLYQHVFKGYPALIYDFKGNPPTLGKTAHTAFIHASLENIKLQPKLMYLNFSDVTRSHRVNPLTKRYLSQADDVEQLVSTLLKNFSPGFRNPKDDFWFTGASAIWVSLILRIQNDPELSKHLCLPLVIELLLTDDSQALMEFIMSEKEARKHLSTILMAQEGSAKQFTGYITSANGFCAKLVNKKIYWLLSQDDVNLDINNPEDPIFFCVASVESKQSVYSPLCAVVMDLVSNYFLEQKKLPTLFQLDEIYTVYLENLPMQANVFRSNGVCMQIGNQTKPQMDEMYDKKSDILIGACGNQFYGQSGDGKSSRMLVELLSDVDKSSTSISTSESGISESNSLKRQKAREVRDIAAQAMGEFSGKIANGEPPFFNATFERYKYHSEEIEIPQFVLENTTLDELENDIDVNYNNICNLAQNIINIYRKSDI